jgi:hypothetical protein
VKILPDPIDEYASQEEALNQPEQTITHTEKKGL